MTYLRIFERISTSTKYWSVGLFLLSLTVKMLYTAALVSYGGPNAIVLGDSTRYLTLAQHVIAGEGYTYDGYSESYRAPGYPAYLMLFVYTGIPLLFASVLQSVVASLLPIAGFFIARTILNLSPNVSGIVGIFVAIEPVQNFYAVTLMPDVYFTALLLGGMYYFYTWLQSHTVRDVLGAGVLIGCANYLRPAGLYLTGLLVLGAIVVCVGKKTFSRQTLFQASLLLIIPILIMAPWCVRNYVLFGHYGFVSSLPYVAYAYAAVSSEAAFRGVEYEVVKREYLVRASTNAPDPSRPTTFANARYYIKNTLRSIQLYPTGYVSTYLLGLNTFWFSGNYHYLMARYGLIEYPKFRPSFSMLLASGGVRAVAQTLRELGSVPYLYIAFAGKIFWFGVFLCSLTGAALTQNRYARLTFVLLVVYFSITILPMTIGVEARHRYAMIPILCASSALGVAHTFGYYTKRLTQLRTANAR